MPTPTKNQSLHGQVPDQAPVALLFIDVINAFDFEGGEELFAQVMPIANHLAELKRRCKAANIPVIYVNDNFGRWQSDRDRLIEHCLKADVRGKPFVEIIRPDDDDYFVLKPKQSGFFSTTLDTLLTYLNAKTVILAGVAGNICILFTAHDAYMRDLHIYVPRDCIASNTTELNEQALAHMEQVLKADITASEALDIDLIKRKTAEE